jgi:ABC-type multidrug transport system fused ATPase/permease subunit
MLLCIPQKGSDNNTAFHRVLIFMLLAAAPCACCPTGGGIILVGLSPQLSGLCLAIFAALWGFTVLYGAYSRHSQRVIQDVLASSTGTAEEALQSVRIVRTFATEQQEQDRYKSWLE